MCVYVYLYIYTYLDPTHKNQIGGFCFRFDFFKKFEYPASFHVLYLN